MPDRVTAPTRAFSAQYGEDEEHGDEGDYTADDTEGVNWHVFVPGVIVELRVALRRPGGDLRKYLSLKISMFNIFYSITKKHIKFT